MGTKRELGMVLLGLAATFCFSIDEAQAQYDFSVPRMRLECFVQPDASVRLVYQIDFVNHSSYQAIDVVDVGLPHADYDISRMHAFLGRDSLSRIAPSSYIDVGVEVDLGIHSLGSSEEGTLRFEALMPDMIYSDTTSDELASFRITPTWFDDSLVRGLTDLQVLVHLPDGVQTDQVLDQGESFTNKGMIDGHALVGWRFPGARLSGPHLVGLSFPRSVMTRVVEVTILDLLEMWWADSPMVRLVVALMLLVVFGVFFFRFSGGTGWSVFLFLAGIGGWLFYASPTVELYSLPLFVLLFVLMEWRVQKRKRTYLPPLANVEGGGIKRGLTAPEGAMLLELPLGRVLTLVVFGMLKKGFVLEVSREPLRVRLNENLARRSRGARRKWAARVGLVIHKYEHAFLDAIESAGHLDVESIDFSDAMKGLIEHVTERVAGFDLSETRKYYRYIIRRAWAQAKSIGELEERTACVDKNLEWLLVGDDYLDDLGAWERSGYVYRPMWSRPGGNPWMSTAGAATGPSGSTGGQGPGLGDVAASFAGWTENVTGQIASSLTPGSVRLDTGAGGIIDLSGADQLTGDVITTFLSSGGGGGGGGGGCACACAGCACACACAGGGR